MVYAPRAKEIYESMGIDYKKKSIIYSDALTVDKALKIKEQCDEVGFACEWCGRAYIHVAERHCSCGLIFIRLIWNRDITHERLPITYERVEK